MKKIQLIVGLLSTLVVVGCLCILVVKGHDDSSSRTMSSAAQTQPENMVGTWTQSRKGIDGILMTANITPDGKISISMRSDPISGSYWAGTFKTSSSNGQIVSTADGDPQLSQDTIKTFTYSNGDLSFAFSMAGLDTVIHLQRSSE